LRYFNLENIVKICVNINKFTSEYLHLSSYWLMSIVSESIWFGSIWDKADWWSKKNIFIKSPVR
jgi:hypothetical protein